MNEHVFCCKTSDFEDAGKFQGISLDVFKYEHLWRQPWGWPLNSNNWIERRWAEAEPEFKQIIPYIIVFRGCEDVEILSYRRGNRGAETRLHSQLSIGIGGHINPCDETLSQACFRVLSEEINIIMGMQLNGPVAILNDDSTGVGRVHLGLVFILEYRVVLDVRPEKGTIDEPKFISIESVKKNIDEYESWSRFCIDYMVPR
jgi:predicted NUDIX family phosphoesterase